MIKKIIVSLGLLFSLASVAQEGSASPYSFYGIGDARFKGTTENRSMGGLSILPDSIHMNLQNPATFASLKLTSFTAGGSFSVSNLKTREATAKAQRTTIDYLAVAFPAGKLGVGFGLMPYTSVGYKINSFSDVEGVPDRSYSGKGGMNKVFLGAGYQITSKLSLGADFSYNFGSIETKSLLSQDVQYGTREMNVSDLSGVSFNTGLVFTTKIKKLDFVSSVTYSPQANLKSENERKIATLVGSSQSEIVVEEKEIEVADSDLKLPSKFAFGLGLGKKGEWFVGAEVTLQESSKFGNRYNDITNVSYENATRYSLGGYFVPDYDSFTSYWNRVTYRAGFKYENTGLVVGDTSIKDYGMTMGLGLPVGGTISNLNIGFEYGRKGTTHAGLVKETYANIFLSLSLNDRWFVKRKYE
ncbi:MULTISPECIES: hypothetical protein [Flavobacterium]|jgi:hypothetical protein|uniref:Long-subunit fatty acid transport protein n=1 Tax=Flavobacterium lindanitolerans TaxID=428988 RepID=A0A497VCS2_9FLAO|nr:MULTISPECIES: hypothetical protein [Flavobacterium]MBU7569323.1 hypothetical protein [Flavobacterium sp.]PZO24405.1 MAG: hypothetical protein DCE86_16670 [Flavobacteriaceae bacterium]PZQ84442.1 MAG: hypothetical protein DI548_09705 [Flavobacterium johnsoniae]KQS46559.1 hypothetical protein ASG38_12260 [Flavobacterium sp. Leaf359]OJX50956.1 MAG: hypothetical protein BGO88_07095 [Flavobacterium sp. 38-13]